MAKNGDNSSVKIPVVALATIEQYKRGKRDPQNLHGLVFPFLWDLTSLDNRTGVRKKIAFTVKRLNDAMVKIMEWIGSTKNASQHKVRHSFAQRAEEKEVHPNVLQKMYRHESVLTTMKY